MSGYVICRSLDGKYVADMRKSKGSYTQFLQNAKIYSSIDTAMNNACGNEYILNLNDIWGVA